MTKRKVLLISSILLTFFFGCKDDYLDLEKFSREKFAFSELPDDVKKVYIDVSQTLLRNDTVVNLMDDTNIKFEKITLNDDHFEFISKGYTHRFIVRDNVKLKFKATKGDPFVFHDDGLFFTSQLNLRHSNIESSEYFKIDLSDILSKKKN
jgi:hypothetical protein